MSIHTLMHEIASQYNADIYNDENVIALQIVQEEGMILSLEYIKSVNQMWLQGLLVFFPSGDLLQIALAYALESNAYLRKTQGAFYTCFSKTSQIILQKNIVAEGKGADALSSEIISFADLLKKSRKQYQEFLASCGQSSKSEEHFDHHTIRV